MLKTYFVVIGILCLALAAWLVARRLRVCFSGVTTSGRIFLYEKREMDDTTSFHPLIVFSDANGQQHQFTSVAGYSDRKPSEGTEVRISYLPSDPKLAYIATFLHMWAAPLALVVLGCAGVAVLWVH